MRPTVQFSFQFNVEDIEWKPTLFKVHALQMYFAPHKAENYNYYYQ